MTPTETHEGVVYDIPKLNRLRESYKQAVDDEEISFFFDGHVYLTDYARYIIEYLEGELKDEQ